MDIVEKYRPNRKHSENHGRFRKCEKKFFGGAGKNFSGERRRTTDCPPTLQSAITNQHFCMDE
jgi:hypothetical protein